VVSVVYASRTPPVFELAFGSFKTLFVALYFQIVVTEEWISMAILRLVESEKCVVEGAGAIGLAAALSGQLNEFLGKK